MNLKQLNLILLSIKGIPPPQPIPIRTPAFQTEPQNLNVCDHHIPDSFYILFFDISKGTGGEVILPAEKRCFRKSEDVEATRADKNRK